MCFSAPASFGASVLLAIAGGVALRLAPTRASLTFAIIPLIFAAQQFCEGLLWMVLADGSHPGLARLATYAFLIVAYVAWPVWVPWSSLCLETDRTRRRIMIGPLVVGAGLASYLATCLIRYGATSDLRGHHVHYRCDFPDRLAPLISIAYGVATVLPPLVSRIRGMSALALVIAFAYLVTAVFYQNFTVSVWCYFSAVLSVIIIGILRRMRRSGVRILNGPQVIPAGP